MLVHGGSVIASYVVFEDDGSQCPSQWNSIVAVFVAFYLLHQDSEVSNA